MVGVGGVVVVAVGLLLAGGMVDAPWFRSAVSAVSAWWRVVRLLGPSRVIVVAGVLEWGRVD